MKVKFFIYLFITLFLSGCVRYQEKLHKELSKDDSHHIQYVGHFKEAKKYKIKGKTYNPKKNIRYKEVGMASWYGSKGGFHGRKTANGDRYNKMLLTAAHRYYPMPSLVKVTNLKNNKSLIVMINDRGPYSKGRIIDVSEKAADVLGFKRQGVAKVRVEYLHKETDQFLKKIALNTKHGARAKVKLKNSKCSINCHVQLINLKYNLAVNP